MFFCFSNTDVHFLCMWVVRGVLFGGVLASGECAREEAMRQKMEEGPDKKRQKK